MTELHDSKLGEAYRAMLRDRATNRRDCVTPDELVGVVDGTLDEADRVRVLRHVGSCARCRHELEMLRVTADAAAAVARPAWLSRPVLAAAAALVLMIGGIALWQRGGGTGADIPRAGAPGPAPELLVPDEDSVVTTPVRVTWSAVQSARSYQIEILDAAGAPVFSSATSDTTVVVPETVQLEGGAVYRYWVRAMFGDGTEARSRVRRFRIATP
jgi:hypothetical protein